MKKWKVAVIGCGDFAKGQYFPNIAKVANAECVAACDIVSERARSTAERFQIPNWYTSIHELLEKCEFDILIDAASIPAHHEINMAALTAGRHVVTQKPAGLSVAEIDMQIEAAKAAGVKLSSVPIHMIRPDIAMARQMIKDGAIGEVVSIKCTSAHGGPEYFQYRDTDPTWFFQQGAGALYDMGVHALHQVTGIMGPAKRVGCMAVVAMKERMVRSGIADGKMIKTDELPDNYFITLDFGDGKAGMVDTGFCYRATKCPPLEIYGTQGVISFSHPGSTWPNPTLYVDNIERGVRGWMEPMGWTKRRPAIFNHCSCLADLIDAIENDRKPQLSAEHARHVIEIMAVLPEASEKGCFMDLTSTF
jgi:UDP-N-acetyl-2-amino-2-deoxyglucuronate dehydrogenase